MELSWPTFFLEIINFLVLVWILKRFLYKPVLEAIAHRKAVIDKTLADANAKEAGAQALVEQYQNRLADWENEKEKLRAGVAEEITARRVKMMAALENSLKQERKKARVLEERRLNELKNQAEEEGIARGVQFTGRLLACAVCPELGGKARQSHLRRSSPITGGTDKGPALGRPAGRSPGQSHQRISPFRRAAQRDRRATQGGHGRQRR